LTAKSSVPLRDTLLSASSERGVLYNKGAVVEREFYILVSVFLGAIAAYVTARVTSGNQLKIAKINSEKELEIQKNIFREDRLKSEVSLERSKLEELHIILSRVNLENSLTVSFMQSDEGIALSAYRERYLENCDRLHIAEAIVALYYPEMTNKIQEIYSQSNIFWGAQEGVLRIDVKENNSGRQANLQNVLIASTEISERVSSLQFEITERALVLSNTINSNCN
jgi:hypothetical protein